MGARGVVAASVAVSMGLLAGGQLAAMPAQAASSAQEPIIAVEAGFQPTPEFGDGGKAQIGWANLTQGIDVSTPGTDGQWAGVSIAPPTNEPLKMGDFDVTYTGATSDPNLPTVSTRFGGESGGFTGELDILDLAWNSNGQITRFDVVLQGVGELSLGEPQLATTDVAEHTLVFGATPRGYRVDPYHQVEWIHNLGSAAESIGTPRMSGQASADFTAYDSTCGTSLAAGAICSFSVGFSPTEGGPRTATMSIPIGGSTQSVALSGEGAIGTTSFTFSGTDPLDHGGSNSFTDGPDFIGLSQAPNSWTWTATTPQANPAASVTLTAPAGGLTPGVHTASANPIVQHQVVADGFEVNLAGEVCEWMPGTIDVHAFTQDAAGLVTMAVVDYSGSCAGDGTLSGTLLWQDRADTTAPTSPSGLSVTAASGGAVSWSPSSSGDVTHTIARVTPGTTAQASLNGGYVLADGSGTTAHLPTLTAGVWTVSVWPVDGTGNVGLPATRTVTIGSPESPVSAASPPTNVTVSPTANGGTFTFSAPTDNGGSAITGYYLWNSNTGAKTTAASSPITVSGLQSGASYGYIIEAITAAGYGQPAYITLTTTTAPPVTSPPTSGQLLPDPSFEHGAGGWQIFGSGTLANVTNPVHSGSHAETVTATSATPGIVGMTQNTAEAATVAGQAYTASCWVHPNGAGLTVYVRLLEYTQNFSSDTHLGVVEKTNLPADTWTQLSVTSNAVASGQRMIPQLFSTNQTTATGSITYDDCSFTTS